MMIERKSHVSPICSSRRAFILQTGAGILSCMAIQPALLHAAQSENQGDAGFTLPPLPYAFDALEPHIDAQTMEIHHDRHHQGYVNNLNKAVQGTKWAKMPVEEVLADIKSLPEDIQTTVRNNGGGHANHSLFWTIMSPKGGGEPKGIIGEAIKSQLGGYEKFKQDFNTAASTVFGSGWAWLSVDGDKLMIEKTPNQDSPYLNGRTPILGIDVWEHAYYLKYQNQRAKYIEAFHNVIDWQAVDERYQKALG